MDLLTRIEASLEFMNDYGGPIRVDFVNLREVLEGSREALLKLDEYERREKLHMERIVTLEQQNEALASRLGAVEDELRHSVSVISSVRSWLMENERGSTHWENCEREHVTCRAIRQLGDVVERLSRLNLTE